MSAAALPALSPAIIAAAGLSKAWPFEEAKRLVTRLEKAKVLTGGAGSYASSRPVIFETGYGPSGLPHIGTFGEVARTSMVRNAFTVLTEGKVKTRLICFSDDMDGLRKVPDNVPNGDMLKTHLDKPLSEIPNPFDSEHPSFAAHNNARLRMFLDQFGFDYEFLSASDVYKAGTFDKTLLKMLAVYDDVMGVILPTIGPDRKATYSPFLPVCPRTGRVLQVPMVARDVAKGTITYVDPETKERVTTLVTGGHVKCQWKADWAMRWTALGVDYEMAGKDLIDSVTLSSAIAKALGGLPPEGFNYELFLDQNGQKISKSKGNGITIEEWLTYATPESLSLYMYQKPRSAKKLFFDVIPRTVDEYLQFQSKFPAEDAKGQTDNPVWHIHSGRPPAAELPISFALLLNLVAASNADNKERLWGFIRRVAPDATAAKFPALDQLVGYAINFYRDFVKPTKVFRLATAGERQALEALDTLLAAVKPGATAEELQNLVFEAGKSNGYVKETLRSWFQAIYEVLLGSSQGPRFGSFIELYGVADTRALIAKGLKGDLVVTG
jgi:lysyl-tRNA synthetase, class I